METFVVRVWKPAAGEAMEGLRGTATRSCSGAEISFSDAEGLLSFMSEALVCDPGGEPQQPVPGGASAQG